MGTDKAQLLLGEPLVVRALQTLSAVCAEVAIAGGGPTLAGFGRVIEDGVRDCGPLGGIVAALTQSATEWNVFLAVDTPFVPIAALQALLAGRDPALVGVMARSGQQQQPLCAVYSRRALPVLQQELLAGRWKVTAAIAAAGEVRYHDFPEESWFRNLNTPEEFLQAQHSVQDLPELIRGTRVGGQ
jgi:molybdopterin-guanine dinucleotide biosynthesis protein A